MKNKKTIIGINASFLRKSHTGIGQVTVNFLKKLTECKVQSAKCKIKEVDFILYLENELPENIKLPKNFRTRVFLPLWKREDLIRKIWWEKFSLPRRVKKDGCDVFLSLYQCPTSIKNIPHLMIVHDIIPKLFPEYLDNARKEIYWKLTERAVKKADKIMAVSKNTEKDLIKHLRISPEKISINYIAAEDGYKKKISEEERAKVLKKYKLKPGYIFAGGGYEIRKNLAGVVRAYKMLWEQNKNLRFVSEMPKLAVYGKILPASLSLALDIDKLVRELNLTQSVKLLGETAQKDMPALFQGAELFVYPSHYEGFGIQVLEAMSSGTPVIASKKSSLPEVGLDSVLYCRPDDVSDIAMVMKNLLVKEHLRQELRRRGLERAKLFSWDKFTERVLHTMENFY